MYFVEKECLYNTYTLSACTIPIHWVPTLSACTIPIHWVAVLLVSTCAETWCWWVLRADVCLILWSSDVDTDRVLMLTCALCWANFSVRYAQRSFRYVSCRCGSTLLSLARDVISWNTKRHSQHQHMMKLIITITLCTTRVCVFFRPPVLYFTIQHLAVCPSVNDATSM